MKKWNLLSSTLAFDNPWFKVRQDSVALPNGTTVDDYFVWLEGEVVLIVPVTRDGKFVLVKQYKHAGADIFIEFPAGMLNQGEKPEEGAKRELREETGYESATYIKLGSVINNPTKAQGTIHIFLAQNAELRHDTQFDMNEEIEVLHKYASEVEQMIERGEIKVTGTISGFLLAKKRLGI